MFGFLISAMVTPFADNGNIDYDCVVLLIKQIEMTGHDSIVVAGSTGEGHSLSNVEKKELYQFVKNHTKLKVIYAILDNSLTSIQDEIKEIDRLKPDGYLLSLPSGILPPERGIYLFFKEIANATKTPIIIYNVPKRTGTSISFITIRKLIKRCPNIVALKEASNDIGLIKLLKKNFPHFYCYCGNDKDYFKAIQSGADGIISVMSVIYGKEMKALKDNYLEGYHHILLDDYLRLVSAITSLETNPIPIKYLLSKKGFPSMNLRLPLVTLYLEYDDQINLLL